MAAPSVPLDTVYARFDPEHPGRGTTDYPGHTSEDIPKSYAMILMAELERTRHGIAPQLPSMASTAGHWLLKHAQLDPTGATGWGVPVAWDAYGDGSVNPEHTAYSISTGIVAGALLDWMESAPDAPREEILRVVGAALKQFAAHRTPSGLAPYSLVPSDRRYDTFNSAAYIAGQMQRMAKYEDRWSGWRLRRAANATMASLIRHHRVSEAGHWYWQYSVQEANSNDLAHASYIVHGMATYVQEGGALADKINLDAVRGHLEEFLGPDGLVRAWPGFETRIPNPARLYDIGMGMHFACADPRLAPLAAQMFSSLPRYRTGHAYARNPILDRKSKPLIVNEYEAYLWRGLVACEAQRMIAAAQ